MSREKKFIKRLTDVAEFIRNHPESVNVRYRDVRIALGVTSETIKKAKMMIRNNISAEQAHNAVKKASRATNQPQCNKEEGRVSKLDATMHRPNGFNFLTVAWRAA